MKKNKHRKEKTFVQGHIMLGITICLGVFVCGAALMIGLSYVGVLGYDVDIEGDFTPPEGIEYKRTLEDTIGIEDKIDLP